MVKAINNNGKIEDVLRSGNKEPIGSGMVSATAKTPIITMIIKLPINQYTSAPRLLDSSSIAYKLHDG